jgi:hypothetical protein
MRQLLHAIGCKYLVRLWLSSGTNETECSSSYEEHSVSFVPLKTMNVPLESLCNKVTTFFRELFKTAAVAIVHTKHQWHVRVCRNFVPTTYGEHRSIVRCEHRSVAGNTIIRALGEPCSVLSTEQFIFYFTFRFWTLQWLHR